MTSKNGKSDFGATYDFGATSMENVARKEAVTCLFPKRFLQIPEFHWNLEKYQGLDGV